MMLQIPQVLSKDQVARLRALIDAGDWVDGNVTSGPQSALAKRNMQLVEDTPAAREAGEMVLAALERHPLFIAAALPLKVFRPLFNRYEGGQNFGNHIDNAVRRNRAGDVMVRTDLSATLFLCEPDTYEGGELVVEDTYGVHAVKLEAGDLILYPASSLHRVEPVTQGARVASFFWVQSMVRDDAKRALLFDMDIAVQQLVAQHGHAHPQLITLTGTYHNLLRMWAEV
jgi:PKHD-type hydroxylase